jgi:hypothetical protein
LKAKRPPAATGGAPKSFACLAAWNSSEANPPSPDLQAFRANFLARRYRLDPTIALVIARIAFATEGGRA